MQARGTRSAQTGAFLLWIAACALPHMGYYCGMKQNHTLEVMLLILIGFLLFVACNG